MKAFVDDNGKEVTIEAELKEEEKIEEEKKSSPRQVQVQHDTKN